MSRRFYLAVLVLLAVAIVPFAACSSSEESNDDGGGDTPLVPQFLPVQVEFCQFDILQYQAPGFPPHPQQPNSPFGGCFIQFDAPEGVYFFNCILQHGPLTEPHIQNFPVFGHGPGTRSYIPINWQPFMMAPGPIGTVDYAPSLSDLPIQTIPLNFQPTAPVNNYPINFGSGIFEVPAVDLPPIPTPEDTVNKYPIPTDTPTTFECGMHAVITNQECGVNECCPAAVSNSLKMIGATPAAGLEISDMKTATGWTASGVAVDWPNTKGPAVMASHGVMTTVIPTPGTEAAGIQAICDVIAAIKAGKDVEVDNPFHVALVTGAYKFTIGGKTYYFLEVAHDTDQGNPGGTVNEILEYDPTTNKFSGGTPGFFPGTILCQFTIEEDTTP